MDAHRRELNNVAAQCMLSEPAAVPRRVAPSCGDCCDFEAAYICRHPQRVRLERPHPICEMAAQLVTAGPESFSRRQAEWISAMSKIAMRQWAKEKGAHERIR